MTAPLLSRAEAAALAESWRSTGKHVVAASGSFDILHAGHRSLLAEARAVGDALLVLINSDASVRAYKGPGRPFTDERERASRVAALPGVDAVLLFDELTPLEILSELKPDVVANGPDYGADCIERPLVESYGGRILVTSPRRAGNSTSAIAHRQGQVANPRAILLDRDGTLIEDTGYLHRPEEVLWKPDVLSSLARLQAADYRLIIVTNQSGIGRGFFTAAAMHDVHRRMREDLAAAGIMLDAIYACPHRPEDDCECRKPQTGLLLQAAREHGLDLSKSWLVGDKCSDIAAGRMANMLTALVHGASPCVPGPHVRAQTFSDAADAIVAWS